jgi:hypothetical protein
MQKTRGGANALRDAGPEKPFRTAKRNKGRRKN